jgi:hypothetical protein
MAIDYDKLVEFAQDWWKNIVLEDGTDILDSVHPMHFADFAVDVLASQREFTADED